MSLKISWPNLAMSVLILGLHGLAGYYCALPRKTILIPVSITDGMSLHPKDAQETEDPLKEVQAITQYWIQKSLNTLS